MLMLHSPHGRTYLPRALLEGERCIDVTFFRDDAVILFVERGGLSKLSSTPATLFFAATVPGSDRGWLDKLQIGGPEDIALLRSTFGAQPAVSHTAVSTRSEETSKSQASVQQ